MYRIIYIYISDEDTTKKYWDRRSIQESSGLKTNGINGMVFHVLQVTIPTRNGWDLIKDKWISPVTMWQGAPRVS